MTQDERLDFLNNILLEDFLDIKAQILETDPENIDKERLFRSLLNMRNPLPVNLDFLSVQDEYLSEKVREKGIISINDLEEVEKNIYLWQGDITRLSVDAIVNAANSKLLGCFIPCHACIDNAIHSVAGISLRNECSEIMKNQGHDEPTGSAKITKAYNLPSKYVVHTVGPIIYDKLTKNDMELLENSYKSCIDLAIKNNLKSIAFCCISTGEFRFPNKEASEIAVKTVRNALKTNDIKVIFNVFKDKDKELYEKLLK